MKAMKPPGSASLTQAESADPVGNEAIKGLRDLRHVVPPAALLAKVMRDVEQPAPFHLWNWLCRPRKLEVRFSPLAGGVMVATAAACLWVVARPPESGFRNSPGVASVAKAPDRAGGGSRSAPQAETVLVRFVLNTQGARKVALAGDFNGWDPQATPLLMQAGDVFAVTLPLRRGETYNYMFWVDGEWVADPSAPLRPDGFGQHNSLLRL